MTGISIISSIGDAATKSVTLLCASSLLLLAACDYAKTEQQHEPIANAQLDNTSADIFVTASDGVIVYGTKFFSDLGDETMLIHLFHQGGSNGRAEYTGIAAWLNTNGYRAIAWDQRTGGGLYGEANRTVEAFKGEKPGYCDAYPDLEAAVQQTSELAGNASVVVWGSSYTAALVFKLARDNPDLIDALIAFSPASGGPMVDCRARLYAEDVHIPMFVLSPATEMARQGSDEQRDILTGAGAKFTVVENGIHGSSMLVDTRTEHDMSATRQQVSDWLDEIAAQYSKEQ